MISDKEAIALPAGFIWRILLEKKQKLHWWQVEFANKFEDPRVMIKASLCTPNGSGKSSKIVAGLALWWISVFKRGKVVIISFDSKQLDHQCWPAIEAHRSRFETEKGWRFIEREVHTPDGAFIVGFTTDDPGRAEGWHKLDDIDGPLLIILDEAKSIDSRVFDAVDRCTYNALAYVSSPGLNEGRFYESQTTLVKSKDNPYGFEPMKVGLKDCPHIPESKIQSIIATHGPDSPFTLSTLHGEFMDADADTMFVCPKSVARAAMEARPAYVHGGKAAFCDFAAGRNENTLTYKEGNRIEQVCWKDPNTMSAIGRFLIEFKKRGLLPSETYGDAGGMGKVFIDRFHELDWPINPVWNDGDSVNPDFENKGAEDAHNCAHKLAEQNLIIPNDPILFKQLTTRRIKFTSDGKIGQEAKKDMAKRGLESPDRADGLNGVLGVDTSLASALFDDVGLKRLEALARGTSAEKGNLTLAGNDVVYEVGAPGSWIRVWERPITGRRYLCVVNPVRHDDTWLNHSVMIFRAGYDDQGKLTPTKLAAKMLKPCRLDAGPLAQSVKMLTTWYGKCFTIPVTNERGDVIDKLLTAGVSIYSRENFERFKQGAHGRAEAIVFGWESNEFNRSLWIGALAEAIRNNQLEIGDPESVMELFQVNMNNAATKKDAESIGVAIKEIVRATLFSQPNNSPFKLERKRDLAKAMIS